MNCEVIEKRLGEFLERHWQLSDIAPFMLVYIRLLLLFKGGLSQAEVNVVLERQRPLLGWPFVDDGFDELRCLVRKTVGEDLKNETDIARRGMLNRLLFCSLATPSSKPPTWR